MMNVGVLALQGGVREHMDAVLLASKKAKIQVSLRSVRTAGQLDGLDALLIPGGESTTLSKLLVQNSMMEKIKSIPALFGTCAGLILMAKEVEGAEEGQRFLHLMDVKVSRNAYGSQLSSFEANLSTEEFGRIHAVFIRAPKIIAVGEGAEVLAAHNEQPVIAVQKNTRQLLLGCTFHPELTTTKVHEYFLRQVARMKECHYFSE